MKKAIIVGASSGIGRQLAVILSQNNYKVGITGRRLELLQELKATSPDSFFISDFDVTNIAKVPQHLQQLADEMGGVDLLVMSSGAGKVNPQLDHGIEKYTNDVNVAGFTVVGDWALNYFERQGSGHFAAITSVAAIRGSRQAPAYNASKAYQVNYLEGMRQRAGNLKMPIYVTDIRPGFVDTPMAKAEKLFWVASVDKAAKQIFKALQNKRSMVYITKRWRLVGFLFRIIPGFLYKKL
jgi:short-subunit dehydrogenase